GLHQTRRDTCRDGPGTPGGRPHKPPPRGVHPVTASPQALDVAAVAARAADEKKATNIVVIDVSEQLVITDCFVLASADTERQVASVVDEIEDKLREAGHKPLRREGTREGRWALLDYNDVVVHVQHVDERDYYSLDRLWKDCPVVEVDGVENTGSPASPAGEHHDDSLARPWALSPRCPVNSSSCDTARLTTTPRSGCRDNWTRSSANSVSSRRSPPAGHSRRGGRGRSSPRTSVGRTRRRARWPPRSS